MTLLKTFSFLIAAFACLLLRDVAEAQTVRLVEVAQGASKQMTALPVHVGGRTLIRPNVAPYRGNQFTHEWPAVYFEAAFNGTKVVLKFSDAFNEYRLFVDSKPAMTIKQVGTKDFAIVGLSTGRHRLRLEKVTESIGVVGTFQGFFVPAPGNVQTVQGRKRQIEFIGDSNMTGYGLRSKTRTCTEEQVRLLSDAQRSYPALVAKYFGADYQVNAVSGRGMVRNYDGFSPEIALPKIYPFALLSGPKQYQDARWRPQITFIALGDNDFFTELNPGETWSTGAELFKSYNTGFSQLLSGISKRNPKTSLVILWPNLYSFQNQIGATASNAAQKNLATMAKSFGFKSVNYIQMPDLGLQATACDYHASASDHLKLKNWLTTYLNARRALWQGQ